MQILICILMVVPIEIRQNTKVRGKFCFVRTSEQMKILLDNTGLAAGYFDFL